MNDCPKTQDGVPIKVGMTVYWTNRWEVRSGEVLEVSLVGGVGRIQKHQGKKQRFYAYDRRKYFADGRELIQAGIARLDRTIHKTQIKQNTHTLNRDSLRDRLWDFPIPEGPTKKFEVPVARTGFGYRTAIIEARTEEEAGMVALDAAGNHLYSEKHSEYEVDFGAITEISDD